jgi:hypothetical protein
VRDRDDELVCLTVYRKGARGGAAARHLMAQIKHTAAAGGITCGCLIVLQLDKTAAGRRGPAADVSAVIGSVRFSRA